jgi:ubiquinone/menaquinone biosynthesis C-methylase UbiE
LNDQEIDDAQLSELITSSWKSQAVRVAAELRLPELLADGPRTSAQLADSADADKAALHRLLRALVTLEILGENDDGTFALTSTGLLLASVQSWSIWWGRYAWPEWGRLLECVKTGTSARSLVTDAAGFDGLDADPERAAVFHSAMAELTILEANAVMRRYDFSSFHHIVDVGGGYGDFLAAILVIHPHARGTIVDLPHSVDGARHHLEQAGVEARCEIVPGDFFESIPPGGDAYIVKNVLHDWDDADARRVLDSCLRAMPAHGRLLVIERVMPDRLRVSGADQSAARSDLHMLVAHGTRERTEAEFRQLLAQSGFSLRSLVPAGGGLSVVEAVPV